MGRVNVIAVGALGKRVVAPIDSSGGRFFKFMACFGTRDMIYCEGVVYEKGFRGTKQIKLQMLVTHGLYKLKKNPIKI